MLLKLRLGSGCLLYESLDLLSACFCSLECCHECFELRLLSTERRRKLCMLFFSLRTLLCPGEPAAYTLLLFLQCSVISCTQLCAFLVTRDQPLKKPDDLRHRSLTALRLLHVDKQHIALVAKDPAYVLPQARADFIMLALQLQRHFPEPVLQLLERLRVEKFAEYFFAVFGGCEQQFQEIALRDHRDLRELVAVDPHDIDDCPVDVFLLRDHSPVRIAELCVRFRQREALAALLRPPVFGTALHGVFLSRIHKHELDFRRRVGVCILRTEHVRFSAAAAGFAVKRERYRIEYSRLACAGVAGYQVKAARSELLEVEFGPAGVRSECRHHKFQRSHLCSSSPQISAASFPTSSDCSSDIGALFCSS